MNTAGKKNGGRLVVRAPEGRNSALNMKQGPSEKGRYERNAGGGKLPSGRVNTNITVRKLDC